MKTVSKYLNEKKYSIVFRLHATKRMIQRDIQNYDVRYVLLNGNIIENYYDDLPLPSFLINGKTKKNRPLHIVAALDNDAKTIIIITVYEPDSNKWSQNFTKRINTKL